MPEDVFRIVIAVAVGLACIAFVVQAGVAIALYRVARKMQQKTSPLIERAEAIATRAVPVIDKIGPVVDKIGPAVDTISPILENTNKILATTHKVIEETRPRIAEISHEAVGIARSGREQVERIGELLHDAGDRARERLEQIDRSVDHTVEHLENAGDTMKRAVLRPVKEVSGLAAGISAAVSSLVHGSRRPSVDSATLDEEMFI